MSINPSEQASIPGAEPVRCAVIAGSQRTGSESARIGRHIAARCLALTGQPAYLLDLAQTVLPACESDVPPDDRWDRVSLALHACDALVVVTPEWGGMAPAALKNFFLLCQNNEIAHKPACLVGVSGGTGGAYPIAELRMSSYKNTHVCYIPEQIIVRGAQDALRDRPQDERERQLRVRIDYALGMLVAYGAALRAVRRSDSIDLARYPYGA